MNDFIKANAEIFMELKKSFSKSNVLIKDGYAKIKYKKHETFILNLYADKNGLVIESAFGCCGICLPDTLCSNTYIDGSLIDSPSFNLDEYKNKALVFFNALFSFASNLHFTAESYDSACFDYGDKLLDFAEENGETAWPEFVTYTLTPELKLEDAFKLEREDYIKLGVYWLNAFVIFPFTYGVCSENTVKLVNSLF